MQRKYFSVLVFSLVFLSISNLNARIRIVNDFNFAATQTRSLLLEVKDSVKIPRSLSHDKSSVRCVNIQDWTSGFFSGNLWYLYEYFKDDFWKKNAELYMNKLESNQYFNQHHDVGFIMYSSYGNAYRLTGNEKYKTILINSAKSLATRYFDKPGVIRSWDYKKSWSGNEWHCPVIVDNLMNLELLFFASKVTNNSYYKNIAISHAEKTLKNNIRSDYSCFHVVNYDTISGKVMDKATYQGFSDNSTWARGQGWCIYGFTMIYRETKKSEFLNAAMKMADYYLQNSNLPKDKIPYWDFNVNKPGYIPNWKYDITKYNEVPRDASAAAIVASGLLELSTYAGNKGNEYFKAGESILKSLSEDYKADKYFILDHSVGNFPGNGEIDVPIIYADYYYLEALLRYKRITKN